MKTVLEKYKNATIGLSGVRGAKIDPHRIVSVYDDYFSLIDVATQNAVHIPYATISHMVENKDGVRYKRGFGYRQTYPLLIRIGPPVQYLPV